METNVTMSPSLSSSILMKVMSLIRLLRIFPIILYVILIMTTVLTFQTTNFYQIAAPFFLSKEDYENTKYKYEVMLYTSCIVCFIIPLLFRDIFFLMPQCFMYRTTLRKLKYDLAKLRFPYMKVLWNTVISIISLPFWFYLLRKLLSTLGYYWYNEYN